MTIEKRIMRLITCLLATTVLLNSLQPGLSARKASKDVYKVGIGKVDVRIRLDISCQVSDLIDSLYSYLDYRACSSSSHDGKFLW